MKFNQLLLKATFIKRINRFLGLANLNEKEIYCFISNPGRMNELLKPETTVYLQNIIKNKRNTSYDLILVESEGKLISIDSRIPNKLVQEAIENNYIDEFKGYKILRTEPSYDDSRFDFLLFKKNELLYLEAKSCTLVINGVAYFPDAPTKRGSRHIKTLSKAKKCGRSVILFIIQRDDANFFNTNNKMDPLFATAIHEASLIGVEAYAYDTKVTLDSITLNKRVPLLL